MSFENLVGLSKPAEKLIEAVSAGVGKLYAPIHERKMAQAQADAKLIAARGDLKVEALRERAERRLADQASRRQANLEDIASLAVSHLPAAADNNKVDPDWMAHFINEAQDTSNEEMQALWARLLAAEVSRPQQFSKLTVSRLKLLSPDDARLFSRLAHLCLTINGGPVPLIFASDSKFLNEYGLRIAQLIHLEDLGLIKHQLGPESFSLVFDVDRLDSRGRMPASYCGHGYFFNSEEMLPHGERFSIEVGSVLLTQFGSELFNLNDLEFNPSVIEYFKRHLPLRDVEA